METTCPSYDVESPSLSPWQDRVRRGLTSDSVRLRLSTYSTLSSKCSESKEAQKQVGQLFGGPRNGVVSRFAGSSLMNVLFGDLRSTDRTLRIAAARVLCLMAYENLTNQQLIIRSQNGEDEEILGVTVGWVHAFIVPQSLRDRYEAYCEERGLFTTPKGLIEFVSTLIKDNYASVYSRINRYYAEGCREFLPLCWSHALVNDSSEAIDMIDVPDPEENLVGFYLVPRQMQFPEQDDYFVQEILSSIRTEAELARLQQVHTAFQQVAYRAPNKEANAAALQIALEGIHNRSKTSLDDEEEALIANQRHSNVLHWLSTKPERMVTWNELLIWCCADMNAEELLKRFGADACRAVDATFRRLTLEGEGSLMQKDQAKAFVWEPAFVGAVLDHPNVPEKLKNNLRYFSREYVDRLEISRNKGDSSARKKPINAPLTTSASSFSTDNAIERPWEYLLSLELTEIHPMSWSVFLSMWRQSADGKPDEDDVLVYHQNGRRHHSVGEGANPSVLVARKNALVTLANNPRIFHSFRDLNQLRQQLPLITNRPIEIQEEVPESPNRSKSLKCYQLSKAEERELEEMRKQFRRLQQSPANLDELTLQRLEDKRAARNKAHESAAEKRKQAELLALERRKEIDCAKLEKQAKVKILSGRREHRWQLLIEARQERHQRAQWWKQIQREDEIALQEEYMQKLQRQNDAERSLREKSQTVVHGYCSNSVSRMSTLPRPPSTPPKSEQRRVSCSRRPSSARSATDPHITRERAHVYGCAATKAFAARRPQTARANFFSGTRSPHAREKSTRFRRRVRPVDSDGSRKDSSSASTTADPSNTDLDEAGVVNACETLVMTNAAHAVAHEIAIPPVTAPTQEEEPVPPAVIMAQYLALEKEQRFKLHERYCGNRVSHKLTLAVLQQLTQEMRQAAAWREFLKAAGGPPGVNSNTRNKSKREAKVTYAAFVSVANQLGIPMPPKRLQAAARSLDPWKTGFVSWESFYSWWSVQ